MNFQVVITQIISLFLLIAVGYFLRRSKHLDKKETGAISKLLLDLIIPAMLISSLQIDITAKMLDNFTDLFLYWIAFYLILILLASIISKSFSISRDKKIVLKFFLIFGNVGYMGLPVIDVIFPENGIFFGSIGVVVFNIFLWTYGANLFLRGNESKKINLRDIFNNGVIAIIIGLFLMLTGLKLPNLIMNAVNMLAEATFPLSMLVIGSGLAQIKIWGIFKDLNIIAYSTLKLLIIPAAALIILNYFNISDPIRTILILQIAMPAAANGVIFAERYEGNYIFAAECLFLSTLMAGFSIPLISYLTTYLK
ncbi:Malate permease [Halanaerobium saccharolyticum subsp. saccharolyticum DSM 6643]|uniref:Malate permease n=1 Tax=Halanaerobium saccharolyticum subsp. saccharolyticum DSM 6643 TaxID=1293054 RepID=M5DY02_9FIRM|nr:AEC family transporter [Halanaerobium saccharolyticum]CCU77807.1 Malate permease [Halanaerobium saccharolyticum subsp. saccharolyticum DSM 6643]